MHQKGASGEKRRSISPAAVAAQGKGVRGQAGGGIGHVVEHAEAVAKILGALRQAAGGHGSLVEMRVGLIDQGVSCHGQGVGGIDAVQPAHAGGHEAGPAAGTTAHIKPFGIGRELIQGKDGEVIAKHAFGFAGSQALLIEALRIITEAGDGAGGEVGLVP
jgi:hypothetical protein